MTQSIPPQGTSPSRAPGIPDSPGRKIGYSFAAVPNALIGPQIKPGPLMLLSKLLCLRQPGNWAWGSNAWLAGQLGKSERLIGLWAKQLIEAGVIERHKVPSPDPDDNRNRTGWRWRFLDPTAMGAGAQNVSTPQACRGAKDFQGASLQGRKKHVGAGAQNLAPNSEGFNSERKEDRSIDSPSSTTGRGDADAASEAIDQAIKIANEWGQAQFAADIESERRRYLKEITSADDAKAFEAAANITASKIPARHPSQCGDGSKPRKGIENPPGYLWRLFGDYRAKGIPAAALKARPNPAKPPKPVDPIAARLQQADAIERKANAITPESKAKRQGHIDAGNWVPHPFEKWLAGFTPEAEADIEGKTVDEIIAQQARFYSKSPDEIRQGWAGAKAKVEAEKAEKAELARDREIMAKMPNSEAATREEVNAYRVANGMKPYPDTEAQLARLKARRLSRQSEYVESNPFADVAAA